MKSPGSTALVAAGIRPRQGDKLPPCAADCASGGDVRAWVGVVAQRRRLGLTDEEAYARAWAVLTAVNPFPATLGRICPKPCETNCSRAAKDGAIAINALERFLGDWALRRGLPLPGLENPGRHASVGVIGAGPAGLSFAYQMARRGHRVTIYEKEEKAGGMLYYGIPQYRLPEHILEAEVRRILDLGVELRLHTRISRDLSWTELGTRHEALFLAIGAGRALRLGIPGEEGGGVWTGTEYLAMVNRGRSVALGSRVVVVGGGNTAIDAARVARRGGASVTLLYRRTRTEMPAIDAEVEDALDEGVRIEYLASPISIERTRRGIRSVVAQRMQLGEPDESGRRRAVAVANSQFTVEADAVITAVSQVPDWEGLSALQPGTTWIAAAADGAVRDGLWTGGDSLGLGIAGRAIKEGRQAAEAAHSSLTAIGRAELPARLRVQPRIIKSDCYANSARVVPPRKTPAEALDKPDEEPQATIAEEEFLREVSRCFSCGSCFGCEQCFTYCNAVAFAKVDDPWTGRYFVLDLTSCEDCGKCVDVCPCGFLEPS